MNESPKEPTKPRSEEYLEHNGTGDHPCDMCTSLFYEEELIVVFGRTICADCLVKNSSLTHGQEHLTFKQES